MGILFCGRLYEASSGRRGKDIKKLVKSANIYYGILVGIPGLCYFCSSKTQKISDEEITLKCIQVVKSNGTMRMMHYTQLCKKWCLGRHGSQPDKL